MAGSQKSFVAEILIKARDLASKELAKIQGAFDNIKSGISGVFDSIINLKNAIIGLVAGAIVKGLYNIGKHLTDMASASETARLQLEVLTGSATAAADALKFIEDFEAKNLVYDLVEIREAFQEMSIKGLDAKADMQAIGDAAAVTGQGLVDVASSFSMATMGMFRGLRQYGIQAADEGGKVVFKWTQDGQTMVKVAQNSAAGIEAALRDVFEKKFAGGMANLQNSWAGMWKQMENVWNDFKRAIMKAGLFDFLKAGLREVLNWILKLKRDGRLDDWARGIASAIKAAIVTTIYFVATLKDVFGGWFNMMRLNLVLFNKFILANLWAIEQLLKALKTIGEYTKQDWLVKAADAGLKYLGMAQNKLREINQKQFAAMTDSSLVAARKLIADIDRESERVAITTGESRRPAGKSDAAAAAKGAADKKKEVADKEIQEEDKRWQLYLKIYQAYAEKTIEIYKDMYDRGEIDAEEFYAQKIGWIGNLWEAEKQYLSWKLKTAKTDEQRSDVQTQYAEQEIQYQKRLIELQREKNAALIEEARRRKEISDLIADAQERAKYAGIAEGDIRARQNRELEEKQQGWAKELDEIDKMNATKEEKENLLNARMAAQNAELIALKKKQNREYQEYMLTNEAEVAGGMANIFGDMYELSGRKAKEFFYLQKAFSIAEAIINAQLAASKALAQGGMWAIPLAAIIYAQAMTRVALIAAQRPGMAKGGLIPGVSSSPTADDILIRATRGEFVQPVDVVQYYGRQAMEALRLKLVPRELFAGLQFRMNIPAVPQTAFAGGGFVTSGASGGTRPINIVNIIDPHEIDRYLASPDGQNAVLNVLSSRALAARRILSS
jgi:hypothetical protein